MTTTSARLIELLQLFQSRRSWTGEELARRLGVSSRTIRSNVAQLRELGFPVEATPGASGGYELAAGTRMAPLLLDDDEAIATAIALRTITGSGITGGEDAAVRALAKLAQVLPKRLEPRIAALQDTIEPLQWGRSRSEVSPEALLVFSQACRDRVQARFGYVDKEGTATTREVEPHTLVADGSRWYLVAFDLDRDDWRTFRVDRTRDPRMLRRRSARRDLPDDDAASYVRRSITDMHPRRRLTVRLHVGVEDARAAFDGRPPGELHADGPDGCHLHAEVHHVEWLVLSLARAGVPFDATSDDHLAERVATLGEHLRRAARG